MIKQSNTTKVSLRQWIDGALQQTIDASSSAHSDPSSSSIIADPVNNIFGDANPRNLALASDNFLLSALTVARLLTDQVIDGSNITTIGPNDTDRPSSEGTAVALPQAGSTSWSEEIIVHLASSSSLASR